MRVALDLGELCRQLRQAEEHELQFDEELNPYLFHTVLSRVWDEEPIRLEEIDFDQFDQEDLITIIDYYEWHDKLCYKIRRINRELVDILPACAKHRAFL